MVGLLLLTGVGALVYLAVVFIRGGYSAWKTSKVEAMFLGGLGLFLLCLAELSFEVFCAHLPLP